MSPGTPAGVAIALLLAFALLVCALSSLGLLVLKGFYNKLHYLAPPAILATAAIATAVLVQEGITSSAVKAWLVVLIMALSNPVLTFAAARAQYLRETQVEGEGKPPPWRAGEEPATATPENGEEQGSPAETPEDG